MQHVCFCIAASNNGSLIAKRELIEALSTCDLTNTMSTSQVRRRQELTQMKKKDRSEEQEAEKKTLDTMWREDPVVLLAPFDLRVDWWHDEQSGGSRFKTWAGQQSVINIARAMKRPIEQGHWRDIPPEKWLAHPGGEGVPFNFDSNLGGQSSDLDIGFSPDPLRIGFRIRPMIELAAFIGLQRFRPYWDAGTKTYGYTLWSLPLMPAAASVAACGQLPLPGSRVYEFRLLFRTEYLKSFLPARPIGDTQ
jgi:CRISPR-associated protein Csb3